MKFLQASGQLLYRIAPYQYLKTIRYGGLGIIFKLIKFEFLPHRLIPLIKKPILFLTQFHNVQYENFEIKKQKTIVPQEFIRKAHL